VNRGEVWWADDPAGPRPYLILSRQTAIPVMQKVVVVPATTTVRGAPSELDLDEDDGMPRACVLSFDNITTIPKSWLRSKITTLQGERLVEVCRTLDRTTGC
jgi:mRNA interferase MazF